MIKKIIINCSVFADHAGRNVVAQL
jgi:hypothetical protein